MIKKCSKLSILLTLIFPFLLKAQESKKIMSSKEVRILVDSISTVFNRCYIYPKNANLMGSYLRNQLKAGAYKNITDPFELGFRLHNDLQQVNKDGHMRIMYDPGRKAEEMNYTPSDSTRNEQIKKELTFARINNFAFKKMEILAGGIGYVSWEGFVDFVKEAKPTLDAAFQFVRNCNALIIDMRDNHGGSPEMVHQIQSYFFEKKIRMNDIIDRNNDTVTKAYADPAATSFKLDMPVYILTSKTTFSAAEDFSYGMKHAKRAMIVGDTTGGGAHPINFFSLGQGFIAVVPIMRSYNHITKTNWEGTGVYPDVFVPSDQALIKAQELILTGLIAKATDPMDKDVLSWSLISNTNKNYLSKQQRTGDVQLTKEAITSYCGTYLADHVPLPPFTIAQKGKYIYRQANGMQDVRLVPVSETKMVYDDDTGRSLDFIREKDGTISGMELSRPGGKVKLNRQK